MEEILKIYNDGSHYVGTCFTRHPYDLVDHEDDIDLNARFTVEIVEKKQLSKGETYDSKEFVSENHRFIKDDKSIITKKHPTKAYYEDLVKTLIFWHFDADLPYKDIKELVIEDFIKKEGEVVFYVDHNKSLAVDSIEFVKKAFGRLGKNFKQRVKRFRQKAYNNKWNYFVTFTYDETLHDEKSFVSKIKRKLSNLHSRKGWLYMGVFERSSVGRLHFHGLFYIPNNSMVGELVEISDYSTEHHKMQTRIENTSFKEKFGINDFKSLEEEEIKHGNVLNYILKYIGKTSEPIFYSRGIKTFIYIKLNKNDDFAFKFIDHMSIRYVLFDDCLLNSIEINVKRMNC